MARPRVVYLLGVDAMVPTLLEAYVGEGLLPNLARVLAQGAYSRGQSVFPGVTPINWASVATGAQPGDHGVVDFEVLTDPRRLPPEKSETFSSSILTAQTLWECAERQGIRVATVDFPQTWPPVHGGITVAGTGSPATGTPFELASSSCLATGDLLGDLRDALPLELVAIPDGWEGRFQVPSHRARGPSLRLMARDGRFQLEVVGHVAPMDLEVGAWTPWLTLPFLLPDGAQRQGTLRIKPMRLDVQGDAPRVQLYISQVMAPETLVHPASAGELLADLGPMVENVGTRALERGWIDHETFLEEAHYQSLWHAGAMLALARGGGAQLVAAKWHFLDHIQHYLWGRVDPVSPWYTPEAAGRYEGYLRRAYQMADAMVGELLEDVTSRGGSLFVVSDHGHIPHLWALSVNNLLAQGGFLRYRQDGERVTVDYETTQAFAGPCLGHVFVNRRAVADVPGTVARVLRYLTEFHDPVSGLRPVTLALTHEEAALLGQWGERAGDIVLAVAPGFTADNNWFPLDGSGQPVIAMSPRLKVSADYGEGKFIAPKFQSTHGCSLPTASLGRGTEACVISAVGAGIRPGYRSPHPEPVTRIAPTIARLLGISPPAKSHEGPLPGFLDEEI